MFSALKKLHVVSNKFLALPRIACSYNVQARFKSAKRKELCFHRLPVKVTVCGAAGKIGHYLALMLRMSTHINELHLYDLKPTIEMALDLNEIDADCKVFGYSRGILDARAAFDHASILVIIAATKGSKSLETDEMFEANKELICEMAELYNDYCPKALLALATNPVNTLIPLLSEQIKIIGCYDWKRIFGVTTLNQIRAQKFTADLQGLMAECVKVHCVGGGCEKTIIPILSHAQPCADFYADEAEQLLEFVQRHRTTIPPITAAQAISRFVNSLLRALEGETNVVDSAYVRSTVKKGLRYMCNPLLLGPGGIEKNLGLPGMTVTERKNLNRTMEQLKCEIRMAEMFLGIDHDKKAKKFHPSQLRPRRTASCPDCTLNEWS